MVIRDLAVSHERFAIRGGFTISRGSRTHAEVVVVTVSQDGINGRGECVPYPRYGESIEQTMSAIEGIREQIEAGDGRAKLQKLLPAGAARNAVDCALWDIEAKRTGRRVWQLADLTQPMPLVTAFTISLGTPEAMAAATTQAATRPLLKIKLGGDGDLERIAAVRAAAPNARLVVDANEAWSPAQLEPFLAAMAAAKVELVEQPLPADADGALRGIVRPVPVGADESVHTREELASLRDRYDVVNLKLDKTGGLTEALAFKTEAIRLGFDLMVGCMVGTSLGMAPAMLVAQGVRFVDLDGPLLLSEDRQPGLVYEGSLVQPPDARLWG